MQKITPCLWFDNKAEEAMNFYISIFKESKVLDISRYQEESPGGSGSVMSVSFELEGQQFMALNGGPYFSFTPAISMFVNCETQEEVDYLCDRLCEGGEQGQCGWLTDPYGISWQIIPKTMVELMSDPDPIKSGRVMEAMLKMHKIDIALLQKAYDGE